MLEIKPGKPGASSLGQDAFPALKPENARLSKKSFAS
jgi:hypothetical protein